MEVVKLCDTPLCNSEVLHFLREKKRALSDTRPVSERGNQAATVVLETLNHLEKSEAVTDLTPRRVKAFNRRIKENNLELTDAERLHLINLCPTTLVEIQVLIDDSEERFTEDQVNLMLEIVQTELLGLTPQQQQQQESADA